MLYLQTLDERLGFSFCLSLIDLRCNIATLKM